MDQNMTTIFYTTDAMGVWTGSTLQIDPLHPLPAGTTTPPPTLANGQFAQLQGGGGVWVVLDAYPPSPPPPPAPRHITRLAFRNRFTQVEKVGLEIAQLDNPSATMPQRAQAAALRAIQADVNVSTFIDLDRADTRAGVQMLEAAGLLSAGRALQILDAEIQYHERYVA